LGEHWSKKTQAARAKRSANRHFSAARSGARHQQICNVSASNEQYESDRAKQHQQFRAVAERCHANQRLGAERGLIARRKSLRRKLFCEFLEGYGEIAIGLLC